MNTLANQISLPIKSTLAKNILLAFLGSIAVAICAQIEVPMYPVPMSMQTFAVLSVGMALGARWGFVSLLMYLGEGAIGLPVFSGGAAGAQHLIGTTGGYLVGFAIAAYVVGYMAERGWDKSFTKAFIAMLAGNVALYIPGLIWLGIATGAELEKVLAWGLTPFMWGMLAKTGVAAALFPALWNKVSKK